MRSTSTTFDRARRTDDPTSTGPNWRQVRGSSSSAIPAGVGSAYRASRWPRTRTVRTIRRRSASTNTARRPSGRSPRTTTLRGASVQRTARAERGNHDARRPALPNDVEESDRPRTRIPWRRGRGASRQETVRRRTPTSRAGSPGRAVRACAGCARRSTRRPCHPSWRRRERHPKGSAPTTQLRAWRTRRARTSTRNFLTLARSAHRQRAIPTR